MNEWMNARPEFKFEVSKKIVDVYSLCKDIDPLVVEKIDFVWKILEVWKGRQSEYKAQMVFKFFMPNLEFWGWLIVWLQLASIWSTL